MRSDFILMLLECHEILPSSKHEIIARIKELKAHVPKLVETFNKLNNANREIEVLKKNLENTT
jgi:hypothetical protein